MDESESESGLAGLTAPNLVNPCQDPHRALVPAGLAQPREAGAIHSGTSVLVLSMSSKYPGTFSLSAEETTGHMLVTYMGIARMNTRRVIHG